MMDRKIALEALSVVCNAKVTSIQQQQSDAGSGAQQAQSPLLLTQLAFDDAPQQQQQPLLSIRELIPTVLDGDKRYSQVSGSNSDSTELCLTEVHLIAHLSVNESSDGKRDIEFTEVTIDKDEFFDPKFDYDFTNKKDTETFYRGGEKYERPCGWYRFALKVLNKFGDNTWLGKVGRTTESVEGEWPVSYHGTGDISAEYIVTGHYKAGSREAYGRGIYSTPDISIAERYAKKFTSETDRKTYKVILQNRINPSRRAKHRNGTYWLIPIPSGTSKEEEKEIVKQSIRPYGLLLKEVNRASP